MKRSLVEYFDGFSVSTQNPIKTYDLGKIDLELFQRNYNVPKEEVLDNWTFEKNPICLKKTFKFKNKLNVMNFLQHVMLYEIRTSHVAKIEIKNCTITFFVATDGLEEITLLDKQYANEMDALFVQVNN